MIDIFGALLVLLGSVFLLLASLGLIRMPDVYNRMQAGTKATTLGSMLIFAGLAFLSPAAWPRLVLLIVFIFLTNPLSSHALARSAHFQRVPVVIPGKTGPSGAARDDLAAAQGGTQ
jgi:multicomponent Na+:H+ antiporter subunit G